MYVLTFMVVPLRIVMPLVFIIRRIVYEYVKGKRREKLKDVSFPIFKRSGMMMTQGSH